MKPIRADVLGCVARDETGHDGGSYPAQPGIPVPDMRIWVSVAVVGTPLLLLTGIAAGALYFLK